MTDNEKIVVYDIYKTDTELIFKHEKRMLWIYGSVIMPCALLFIYISFVPEEWYLRTIFLLVSASLFLLFLWGIIYTFSYGIVINEKGVAEKRIKQTRYLNWTDIADIGLCCSQARNPDPHIDYVHDFPKTTFYFSVCHLSEHEKSHFYKNISCKKRMIYIEQISSPDMDRVCELIYEYVKKYTDLPLTRFNSKYLRCGVE